MSCGLPVLKALTTPGLSHVERNVYAYYVGRARARLCWPSGEETQTDLGIKTRATLAAANGELVKRGLIAIKRRFRDTNHYWILDPGGLLYGLDQAVPPWSEPQYADVQETEHLDQSDVQETEHLGQSDVQETEHLAASDASPPPDVQSLNVQQTAQESDSQVRSKEEREERKNVVLRTTAPAEPDADPDTAAKAALWEQGVPILSRLRKPSDPSAGSIIGRLLKVSQHDYGAVLDAVLAAERSPPLHLLSWLTRVIQNRVDPVPMPAYDPSKLTGAAHEAMASRQRLKAFLEQNEVCA